MFDQKNWTSKQQKRMTKWKRYKKKSWTGYDFKDKFNTYIFKWFKNKNLKMMNFA